MTGSLRSTNQGQAKGAAGKAGHCVKVQQRGCSTPNFAAFQIHRVEVAKTSSACRAEIRLSISMVRNLVLHLTGSFKVIQMPLLALIQDNCRRRPIM
jgi:hypothetical protein